MSPEGNSAELVRLFSARATRERMIALRNSYNTLFEHYKSQISQPVIYHALTKRVVRIS